MKALACSAAVATGSNVHPLQPASIVGIALKESAQPPQLSHCDASVFCANNAGTCCAQRPEVNIIRRVYKLGGTVVAERLKIKW